MTKLKQQIITALEDADAVVGTDVFLTTNQHLDRTDVSGASINNYLQALRFSEQTVAKGLNDRWQLADPDAVGVRNNA